MQFIFIPWPYAQTGNLLYLHVRCRDKGHTGGFLQQFVQMHIILFLIIQQMQLKEHERISFEYLLYNKEMDQLLFRQKQHMERYRHRRGKRFALWIKWPAGIYCNMWPFILYLLEHSWQYPCWNVFIWALFMPMWVIKGERYQWRRMWSLSDGARQEGGVHCSLCAACPATE